MLSIPLSGSSRAFVLLVLYTTAAAEGYEQQNMSLSTTLSNLRHDMS